MTRQLIEQIMNRIRTELPDVKSVGIFNNTFERIAAGDTHGVMLPAIYISFPEGITYQQNGSGAQRTDNFVVRLNIGFRVLTPDKILDAFDFKTEVFKAFHKWQPSMSASFARVSEVADELYENVYVFQMDFLTNTISDEKFIDNETTPTNVDNLKISSKYVDNI